MLDWVKIWFLAKLVASAEKSSLRIVDMLALLFCSLFIGLDEEYSKRFCKAPTLERASLIGSIAACEFASELRST